MSKGLGKLQRAVLAYVTGAGGPVWVKDLAWGVFNEGQGDGHPSRAFAVAVRRAIRGLCERKLLCCAEGAVTKAIEQGEHYRLVCWLPGSPAPETREGWTGAQVEAVILDVLEKARELDRIERHVWNCDSGDFAEGLIPYHYVMAQACRRLQGEAWIQGAAATAVHRAVKRMAKRGEIRGYWRSYGRFGLVGLKETVSVAV